MQAIVATQTRHSCDILILGAGYGGLLAALRLRRRGSKLRVILVNSRDLFVERVRLQEQIVADIAPRIPSIGAFVAGRNVEFIEGEVRGLDADRRTAQVKCRGVEHDISFGQVIYALGSHVDLAMIPGAAENAYRLDTGDGPSGVAALRERVRASAGMAPRVAVIGGAESGIEAAAEIKTAWPRADVTLIDRSRIGDLRGPRVTLALRDDLTRLGIALIDGETIIGIEESRIATQAGRRIACDICILAAGLSSPPIAAAAGLATDQSGRILVGPNLHSISHPDILAIGDAAHPVAPTGAPYRRSAFAALVTGAYAADDILARQAGRELAPFSFSVFGQGIAVGKRGVGFPSYPDDRQMLFVIRGRLGLSVRNMFVWFITYLLRLERRFPGFFFWLGRSRISRRQAEDAMRQVRIA
jgi:NADH dehydrogenase FAD-containing subunit